MLHKKNIILRYINKESDYVKDTLVFSKTNMDINRQFKNKDILVADKLMILI